MINDNHICEWFNEIRKRCGACSESLEIEMRILWEIYRDTITSGSDDAMEYICNKVHDELLLCAQRIHDNNFEIPLSLEMTINELHDYARDHVYNMARASTP